MLQSQGLNLPVFVVASKTVDYNWNWQSHDENTAESAKPSNLLPMLLNYFTAVIYEFS
jgi:hypothetical protein